MEVAARVGRAHSWLVLSAALILFAGLFGCSGGPGARYSRACALMEEASYPAGSDSERMYNEALGILTEIRAEEPSWNSCEVQRRLDACRNKIHPVPGEEGGRADPGELLARVMQIEVEEIEIRERAGRSGSPAGEDAGKLLLPSSITFRERRTGPARAYSKSAVEHYNKAKLLVGEKEYNGALAELREAVFLEEGYVEAYIALGEIYEAVGEDNIAGEAYRSALGVDDDAAAAHCGIGNILIREGARLERDSKLMEAWAKYQNAVLEYKRATWVDIGYAPAYYGIGVAYSRLGRHSDAAYYWNKTIEAAEEGSEHGRSAASNLAVTGLAR
ncbi:MAG: hypothetical protein P9M00_06745 [Candidatus Tritonobacter lacicola]|nr:hypothetical protein [Candidatus Tritonobacter lacicola]